MAVPLHSLYTEDVSDIVLKSLFSKYDLDGNGSLNKEELYKLFINDFGFTENQAENVSISSRSKC